MMPSTVDLAFNAVNPDLPLTRGDADVRYVNCSAVRGGEDEVALIARAIRRSEPPNYFKPVFTGHRGCGKSTELFRLKRMLEAENFFAVYFDAETELDISDLDYPDVLLTIAQEVERQLREASIELDPELLQQVAGWFSTTVITDEKERGAERTLGAEFSLGAEIPLFAKMLATLKGEIKSSSKRRTEIRSELERNALQLIQRVNDLIENAKVKLHRHGKRGLVLIADGLEKVIYHVDAKTGRSSHELLFMFHGEQLCAPQCHIVYTIPINLILSHNVTQIYSERIVLPMIKIAEEDGSPCQEGRTVLRQIVANRLNVSAIFSPPELVDELVAMSGGHVRDLLLLVRYAFDYTDFQVLPEHVASATRRLVNDYDYLIKDEDLPLLTQVHNTRRVPNDEPHALLLYNLLVLEYRNGARWADVHPAAQAARKLQEHVKKSERKTRKKK